MRLGADDNSKTSCMMDDAEQLVDRLLCSGQESVPKYHNATSVSLTIFNDDAPGIAAFTSSIVSRLSQKVPSQQPSMLLVQRASLVASMMHDQSRKQGKSVVRYIDSRKWDLGEYDDVVAASKSGARFFVLAFARFSPSISVVSMMGFEALAIAASLESSEWAASVAGAACEKRKNVISGIAGFLASASKVQREHGNQELDEKAEGRDHILEFALQNEESQIVPYGTINKWTLQFNNPDLEKEFSAAHAKFLSSTDPWRFLLMNISLLVILFGPGPFKIMEKWPRVGHDALWASVLYIIPAPLMQSHPSFYIKFRDWIVCYVHLCSFIWTVSVFNYVGFVSPEFFRARTLFFHGFSYLGIHSIMWLARWVFAAPMVILSGVLGILLTSARICTYAYAGLSLSECRLKVLQNLLPWLLVIMSFCYLYEANSRRTYLARQQARRRN